MRMHKGLSALGLVIAGVLAFNGVANAASQRDEVGDPAEGIEEILVTAQRREQSVQDVPASIEAFSAAAIERLEIQNIGDVVRLTPGLYASPGGSTTNTTDVYIRGIGSDVGSSSTAIYINDTPVQVRDLGASQSADSMYPMVFGLERVEVLRGPQGTLFGSSAQGGAVRFITPEPGPAWEGRSLLELSHVEDGDQGYQVGIAGGGPLSSRVGFSGSAYVQKEGGWIDFRPHTDNLLGDDEFRDEDDANSADNLAVMGTVVWDPTDRLTITPSVLWQKQELNGQSRYWRGFSSSDDYVNGDLFPAGVENEFVLGSLSAEWRLDAFSVYSTTSYLDRTRDAVTDLSFGFSEFFGGEWTDPVTSVLFSMENPQKQFTQEIRLQGETDRLNWVAGGFYRDLKQKADFAEFMPDFDQLTMHYFGVPVSLAFGSDLLPGGRAVQHRDDSRDTEIAGFGQVDFRLTPKWTITGGLRVAKSDFETSIHRQGPLQTTPGVVNVSSETSETVWLPKFGLQYQPLEDWMLYASASRGFRPGGGNTTPSIALCADGLDALGLSEVPGEYDADFLDSYEIGVKGNSADGRLAVAATAFRSEWDDQQNSVGLGSCGLRFISNLGSAVSQGVELQLNTYVLRNLSAGLSFAYVDGYFQDTISIGSETQVESGDSLPTPPWTITASVDYSFYPFGGTEAYVHADAQYASSFDLGLENDDFLEANTRGSTLIAAARVGMRTGVWDVAVFARNLFDSDDVIRASEIGGQVIDQIPTPRTLGLTVRTNL